MENLEETGDEEELEKETETLVPSNQSAENSAATGEYFWRLWAEIKEIKFKDRMESLLNDLKSLFYSISRRPTQELIFGFIRRLTAMERKFRKRSFMILKIVVEVEMEK